MSDSAERGPDGLLRLNAEGVGKRAMGLIEGGFRVFIAFTNERHSYPKPRFRSWA
jgi:hypothetical protein